MVVPLAIAALIHSIIEHLRGWTRAPAETKVTLRSLWRGLPAGDYGKFAFHDAPDPTRSRLRRSAIAYTIALVSFAAAAGVLVAIVLLVAHTATQFAIGTIGASAILAISLLAAVGVVIRSLTAMYRLSRRPPVFFLRLYHREWRLYGDLVQIDVRLR